MTAPVDKVTADLRSRLAIPSARLDDLNALLLDPESRVVNDILAVVARYGTPEEINARARAAGELPALLARVRAAHPAYLADLEWLAGERERGAFVSVADFRRGVLGAAADTTAFRDDIGGHPGGQRAPVLPVGDRGGAQGDRRALAHAGPLDPGPPDEGAGGRRRPPGDRGGDEIIGASFVETLDTKGTDGSNVHLGGPATITGYFGGIGQPNDHPLLWLDEFLYFYTEYGVRQVLNINPGTVLAGYLLHRLGVDIEFKISVFMGNDNPYAGLWTLIGAKLFARDDGTSALVGFNWGNSANNETLEITAEVRRALGFEDVIRFEHHITETLKSIVLPAVRPARRARGARRPCRRTSRPSTKEATRRWTGRGPTPRTSWTTSGPRTRSSQAATGRACSSTSWTSSTRRTTRRGRSRSTA